MGLWKSNLKGQNKTKKHYDSMGNFKVELSRKDFASSRSYKKLLKLEGT